MDDSIARLLNPQRLILNLDATTKRDAICEVAGLLKGDAALRDPARFSADLLKRDEVSSTAAGDGVAFPHARTDAVSEIVLACGRTDREVDFNGTPVRLIFVIGTPRQSISEYLLLMSTLARRLKRPDVRAALLAAASPAEFANRLAAK